MLDENEENKNSCALIGSVGNDHYGRLYEELVKKENIVPFFEKFDSDNTGICCVYCYDRDRGHITDLGVSILISENFVSSLMVCIQAYKNTGNNKQNKTYLH